MYRKIHFNYIMFLIAILALSSRLTAFEVNPAGNRSIEVYSFEQFKPWLTRETDSVYVVNFWATWCAPCIKEIPDFERIQANYAHQKVKVLFVSLDFPGQVESRVIPFVERMNMKGQVVVLNEPNANRWIPQVNEKWSGAIPATLVYGKNFRQFYEKELTYDELESILLPIIK
jgi:thiol-disulfide isomerase/thioredoxin